MDKKFQEKYLADFEVGLKHVKSHAVLGDPEGEIEKTLSMIENGEGSRDGCIRVLSVFEKARCIYSWFGEHDLNKFKFQAYMAAKLRYIMHLDLSGDPMKRVGRISEVDYFWLLLSDHAPLIAFYSRPDVVGPFASSKDAHNLNNHYYRHAQLILAVQGRWDELGTRAQTMLDNPPPRMGKFMIDQRFYLALAQGDKLKMEEILEELTSPKMAMKRNSEFEFAFFEKFIGTHACLYAKVAWRHGYEVAVDTPYIPKEWLPVRPLEKYEDPYPFMRVYPTDDVQVMLNRPVPN